MNLCLNKRKLKIPKLNSQFINNMNKVLFLLSISNIVFSQLDTFPCTATELAYECGADGRTYKNACYRDLLKVALAYHGKCVNCENCTGIQ